ncbi:Zinc finger protein-like 1, variant 2 [Balamuthia mandrillaris]
MGLCKCRTITDLYCFVHKKAVCEHCVFPEHKVCVVGTYVEWLQDPDYEPPTCAVCKEELTEDNVLRLLCLDMFHPECIDVHAASFPPNTAQAGFTCPSCPKGIIPSSSADLSSPLAQQLLRHLNNAPWYKGNNLSSLVVVLFFCIPFISSVHSSLSLSSLSLPCSALCSALHSPLRVHQQQIAAFT